MFAQINVGQDLAFMLHFIYLLHSDTLTKQAVIKRRFSWEFYSFSYVVLFSFTLPSCGPCEDWYCDTFPFPPFDPSAM